jgi:hypothetical protein
MPRIRFRPPFSTRCLWRKPVSTVDFNELVSCSILGYVSVNTVNDNGPDIEFIRQFRARLSHGTELVIPVLHDDMRSAADYLCECSMDVAEKVIHVVVIERITEHYAVDESHEVVRWLLEHLSGASELVGLKVIVSHGRQELVREFSMA